MKTHVSRLLKLHVALSTATRRIEHGHTSHLTKLCVAVSKLRFSFKILQERKISVTLSYDGDLFIRLLRKAANIEVGLRGPACP